MFDVSFLQHFVRSLKNVPDPRSKQGQSHPFGHWQVENCLHWQKDRYFGEDKHVCGDDWGVAGTVLTNMALSLASLLRKGKRTLKEVRERCCIDPRPVARKLGRVGTTSFWGKIAIKLPFLE